MARQDFRGGAAKCTAGSAVSIGATSVTLVGDTSGWPTGASGRPFLAIFDRGVPGKMEKVLCSAMTGATLTITQRGYDGTTAIDHDANCDVEHGFGASVFDDLSGHTYDTSRDDHEQYLPVDTTIRGFADVAGITGAPVSVSGANQAGTSDLLARADHVHAITPNAVDTVQLADDAVEQTKIAAGAVGSGELADDAVTNVKVADSAIGTTELQDGAVTNAKLAANSVGELKIIDTAITPAKLAAGALGGMRDVAVTTASTVGGGAVTLGTIVIPAQPFAYTLDASAFWTAQNGTQGDAFQLAIQVDGVTKAAVKQQFEGAINLERPFSIPCIELVSIAASTACTVTCVAVRYSGSGALTQVQAGRMVVRLSTKAPV